ncbi:MAG: hypothetical protein V1899_07745 [Planctomycetota bacterium]
MESDSRKKKKAHQRKDTARQKALLLGVGLDADDGHVRITKGSNFRLMGGSRDTHEQMQEMAIKLNEELDRRHQRLEDIGPAEFVDIIKKASDE